MGGYVALSLKTKVRRPPPTSPPSPHPSINTSHRDLVDRALLLRLRPPAPHEAAPQFPHPRRHPGPSVCGVCAFCIHPSLCSIHPPHIPHDPPTHPPHPSLLQAYTICYDFSRVRAVDYTAMMYKGYVKSVQDYVKEHVAPWLEGCMTGTRVGRGERKRWSGHAWPSHPFTRNEEGCISPTHPPTHPPTSLQTTAASSWSWRPGGASTRASSRTFDAPSTTSTATTSCTTPSRPSNLSVRPTHPPIYLANPPMHLPFPSQPTHPPTHPPTPAGQEAFWTHACASPTLRARIEEAIIHMAVAGQDGPMGGAAAAAAGGGEEGGEGEEAAAAGQVNESAAVAGLALSKSLVLPTLPTSHSCILHPLTHLPTYPPTHPLADALSEIAPPAVLQALRTTLQMDHIVDMNQAMEWGKVRP